MDHLSLVNPPPGRARVRAAAGVGTVLALALSSFAASSVLAPTAHGARAEPLPNLGTPVIFGGNDHGQAQAIAAPAGATKYLDVAVGHGVSLGLTDSGHIIGAGSNWSRQLEVPALPSGATKFTAVAVGGSHALALTDDGRIVAWGDSDSSRTAVPGLPTGSHFFTRIATAPGSDFSAALTDDGQALTWGSGENGPLEPFVLPAGSARFTDIAIASDHAVALTNDGRLVAVGSNEYGQTDIPTLVTPERYVDVATGYDFTVALTSTGRAVVSGGVKPGNTPIGVPSSSVGFVSVVAGFSHFVLTDADGTVSVHRSSDEGEELVPAGDAIASVGAGYRATAFLTKYSGVKWGGNGTRGHFNLPELGHDGRQAAVVAGNDYTLALDMYGQLNARGTATGGRYALDALNRELYSAVAAGPNHSVAVDRDGDLVGFGYSSAVDFSALPTGVEYVAVAAGDGHTLALDADGVIRGAGGNAAGQLDVPELPAGSQRWTAVAAGDYFSLALSDQGVLRGFGSDFRQPGGRDLPALPAGASRWVAVDAGGHRAIVLADNGVAVAFGAAASVQELDLPDGAHRFVEVGVHGSFVAGVADNGELVTATSWGSDAPQAPRLPAGQGYVSVDVGGGHFAALTRPLVEQVGVGVEISGTPAVGSTLTALITGAPAADRVSGGTSGSFRWAADGVELLGSTGSTLAVTPDLLGKTISVTARLVRFEHQPTSSATTMSRPVELGVQATPGIAIDGVAKAGHALTGRVAEVPEGVEVAWSWKRGESVVSTTSSYVATDADAGQRLTLAATFTRRGYHPITVRATSAEVAPREAPVVSLKTSTSEARLGQSVVLTWQTSGADTVVGSWTTTPLAPNGSVTLKTSMLGQQNWTVTASNPRTSTSAAVTVAVALPAATFVVDAVKQVRSQKSFAATITGLRAGEAFTARFGKQSSVGVADPQGTARVRFVAPLKNRALRLKVTVQGEAGDRKGSASVTVLGRTIVATTRRAVVRSGATQTVTLKRLGVRERILIVRDGKRTPARATKHGTYTHRFSVGSRAGTKKLKVIASRTGRSVTVGWRVRR